jgi:Response regulator containing CheY-like receiver, AAA-type ATPase, and DNA-binding domains
MRFLSNAGIDLAERIRVLIVDDDEGIRASLAAVLKKKDYDVDTAKNGKEAIQKCRKNFYNVLLVDIKLPDMEGVELLKRVPDTVPKMRKIIVTGYPTLNNAVQAVNLGADAYVIKPFDVDNLLLKINEQVSKQKEEKEYSEDKVKEFVEARAKSFEKTLEEKKKKASQGKN